MIGIEETNGFQQYDGTSVPDAALDSTSTNSVQNKVITEEINEIKNDLDNIKIISSYSGDGTKTNATILHQFYNDLNNLSSDIDPKKLAIIINNKSNGNYSVNRISEYLPNSRYIFNHYWTEPSIFGGTCLYITSSSGIRTEPVINVASGSSAQAVTGYIKNLSNEVLSPNIDMILVRL